MLTIISRGEGAMVLLLAIIMGLTSCTSPAWAQTDCTTRWDPFQRVFVTECDDRDRVQREFDRLQDRMDRQREREEDAARRAIQRACAQQRARGQQPGAYCE